MRGEVSGQVNLISPAEIKQEVSPRAMHVPVSKHDISKFFVRAGSIACKEAQWLTFHILVRSNKRIMQPCKFVAGD
jgi:hypothetical protein